MMGFSGVVGRHRPPAGREGAGVTGGATGGTAAVIGGAPGGAAAGTREGGGSVTAAAADASRPTAGASPKEADRHPVSRTPGTGGGEGGGVGK